MDIVTRLIEQLGSDDEVIKVQAGEMLLQLGSAAVRPLISALQNPTHPARHMLASTLGQIGDKRAIEPLIQTLRDKNKLVRLHSALALGNLKDKRAIKPLIHSLFDESPPIGIDPLTGEEITVRSAAAQALGDLGSTEAVSAMKVLLNDEHKSTRRAIIQALGKIATEEALSALHESAFNEPDPMLRQLAVLMIRKIPSPKTLQVLQDIVENHHDLQLRELAKTPRNQEEELGQCRQRGLDAPKLTSHFKRLTFLICLSIGLIFLTSIMSVAWIKKWSSLWLSVAISVAIVLVLVKFRNLLLRHNERIVTTPDPEPSLSSSPNLPQN